MGEAPILVWRDSAGKLQAFLNVCSHRGNRLCRADAGNATAFTCAYDGWTYSNDGRLVGVPYLKKANYSELERERWGLQLVAHWTATRDWCLPPSTRRHPRCANIWGKSPGTSTCFSTVVKAASKSSAACANGSSSVTGNSLPRIFPATPTTCRGATFRRSGAGSA